MTINMEQMLRVLVDSVTKKAVFVDYEHHEIHDGEAFVLSQSSALNGLDIASPLTYRIITPNTQRQLHIVALADMAASGTLEIFEDIGNVGHYNVSGGTLVIPRNRNRNSSDYSRAACRFGATVTAAGPHALLFTRRMGGFRQSGGAGLREEFVLASGTEYLFRLSTDADNNEGSLILEWYEHTDRS